MFNSLKLFLKYLKMSLSMYIRCHCYMFQPHMSHLQTTFIILADHCTVHFVLSTLRHIVQGTNSTKHTQLR
jgi:hypothetical protein